MKKEKIIFLIGIFFLVLPISIYGVTTLYDAIQVAYDNSKSGTTKTNVQDALDELYEMSKICPNGYICTEKVYTLSFDSDYLDTELNPITLDKTNENYTYTLTQSLFSSYKRTNYKLLGFKVVNSDTNEDVTESLNPSNQKYFVSGESIQLDFNAKLSTVWKEEMIQDFVINENDGTGTDGAFRAADLILFSFSVKNVTDMDLTDIYASCELINDLFPIEPLKVGEISDHFTATHTVTSAETSNGSLTFEITVTGTAPDGSIISESKSVTVKTEKTPTSPITPITPAPAS